MRQFLTFLLALTLTTTALADDNWNFRGSATVMSKYPGMILGPTLSDRPVVGVTIGVDHAPTGTFAEVVANRAVPLSRDNDGDENLLILGYGFDVAPRHRVTLMYDILDISTIPGFDDIHEFIAVYNYTGVQWDFGVRTLSEINSDAPSERGIGYRADVVYKGFPVHLIGQVGGNDGLFGEEADALKFYRVGASWTHKNTNLSFTWQDGKSEVVRDIMSFQFTYNF